jgi:hypothetical protein
VNFLLSTLKQILCHQNRWLSAILIFRKLILFSSCNCLIHSIDVLYRSFFGSSTEVTIPFPFLDSDWILKQTNKKTQNLKQILFSLVSHLLVFPLCQASRNHVNCCPAHYSYLCNSCPTLTYLLSHTFSDGAFTH